MSNPLQTPSPPDILLTPTQMAFYMDSTRFRLLCGGLGSGKTTTGAMSFLKAVCANPNCAAMMVAPTFPMFEAFMRPAWEAVCPKEYIVGHSAKRREYLLAEGQIVRYGSAEVPKYLEGQNLGAFWADEVRYWKAVSWRNLIARLRDKRANRLQGIATSTPSMGWMEKEFNRGMRDRRTFRIGTRENAAHLAPDYIENLQASFSPRLCQALLDGEFALLDGQVYESFDQARHLVDWKPDYKLRTTVWIDFGVRRSSVLFAQHAEEWPIPVPGRPKGVPPKSMVIFDELQPEQRATDQTILAIQEVMKKWNLPPPDRIFCDPAGNARSIDAGMTSVRLLESSFGKVVKYQTDPRYTWVPNGIAAVERVLAPLVGEPRLYIDRRLAADRPRAPENDLSRGIVATLKGYRYPEAKDGRPVSDHPVKDGFYEHCADALRYGVMGTLISQGEPIVPSPGNLTR